MEREQQQQAETPFTPYELYCEVQRMRLDMVALCASLDRISAVLEQALKLPATQALEASLRAEPPVTQQPAPPQKSPPAPLDVEQWLKGAIKAVLIKAERELTNTEIRARLPRVVEQGSYTMSKQVINKALHCMAQEGTLWCERRAGYSYWSLVLAIDVTK